MTGESLSSLKKQSANDPEAFGAKVEALVAGGSITSGTKADTRPIPTTMPDGEGLDASLARLRAAERLAAATYFSLAGDPGPKSTAALNAWISLAEEVRKIEKDLPEILRANASVVACSEVEASFSQVTSAFAAALSAVPLRLSKILEGLSAVEIEHFLGKELNEVILPTLLAYADENSAPKDEED